MDLDDMKHLWRTLDARVTRLEHAQATRGAVRGAIAAEIAKLVAWAVMFAFAVPRLADVPVAAGAIALWAALATALGAWQLRAAFAIAYGAPIVELQRELLALDRLRAGASLALGLPWWLLWIAFPVVAAAWAGVDLYAHARVAILANIGVGLVGLVLHVAISRAVVARAPHSPRIRRMLDRFAATRLRRAAEALGDVAQFSQ